MDFPQHAFWDFSVALYAKPGVAPACLDLQERHGLDVNVLLFCLWLGQSGRGPVPGEALAAAFDAVAGWHDEVVRTLRPLRRQLKAGFEPIDSGLVQTLRARLQKVEIDAEHVEQLALAASAASQTPARAGLGAEERAGHSARHTARYFAQFGGQAGAPDIDSLCGIFAAAFDLPAPVLRAHLEAAFR